MTMHTYLHTVQYYECDPMAVMHHSNYVRVMEESRVDWMETMGFGYARMEAEGVVSPVTAISVDYKHPSHFSETIAVAIHVLELGTVRLRIGYEMKVGDRLVATATSTHCFVENGRPVALERRFPEFYESLKTYLQ